MAIDERHRRALQELGGFHPGTVFRGSELAEIRCEYDRILGHALHTGERGRTPFTYRPLLHVQSERSCHYATHAKRVATAVDLLRPDVRLYWAQAHRPEVARAPARPS